MKSWKLLSGMMLAAAGQAQAEPLSYDYVYASYNETEFNDQDASGTTFGAFYTVNPKWHLFASFGSAGWGPPSVDAEQDVLRAGFGGIIDISEDWLVSPGVAWVRRETRTPAVQLEETGYGLQLETRYRLATRWEIAGGLRYTKIGDTHSDSADIGLFFHLNDYVAVGGVFHDDQGVARTEITARWYLW